MVYGIPLLANYELVCEGCATEKAYREAFAKDKTWKASIPLELVHTYVC